MRPWSLPLAALLLAVSSPSTAAPPFVWPVACTLGETCWIVRHVDRDTGPGRHDVACGRLTGDDHRGTDIALADLSALARGVHVLAPASGRVVGVRDGMPDIATDAPGSPPLDGRNCGNGVRLEHGDGWVSQLCHLRRGSLRVRVGDTVETGDPVGLVGLSGETSFPHLHIGFEHEGADVDPMDGAAVGPDTTCGGALSALFDAAVAYEPLPLVGVGIATTAPEDADLLRGWHRERRLPVHAPALVVWGHAYGTAEGDAIRLRLRGPDGGLVVDHERRLTEGHARGSFYAGARRPADGWPAGRYVGTVEWRRGDGVTMRRFELRVGGGPPPP